jgi:hypothetical protein
MAKVLAEHDFSGRGGNSGSRYDKYMDGKVYKLKPGTDCSKNITSARSYFYMLGTKHGLEVHTDVTTYPGFLVVQAVRPDA